ncbi:hypothetical protein SNE40_010671 [Patella caerulea]|uniref:GON domain-containing protein n=1 Tax=Patella caerulea TaxID=87958 RepID=A0AAN8JYR1_PATCE
MVVVAKVEYGCYVPEDSLCSKNTLSCPVGERIRFESMRYYTKPPTITCPKLQNEEDCRTNPCCYTTPGDAYVRSSNDDLIHVFKACSYQQSCTISPPHRPLTEYRYVKYFYSCMPESNTFNITTRSTATGNDGHNLYFSGKDTPVKELTCSCDITSDGGGVYLYNWVTYLTGGSCPKLTVLFLDRPEYTCNDDGVFTAYISDQNHRVLGGRKYRIVFNNMTSSHDDIIWIRFNGPDLTVSCDCNKAVMPGGWGNWSYSTCSKSCGLGTSIRTRKCNNPAPANGGKNCPGSPTEEVACHRRACGM